MNVITRVMNQYLVAAPGDFCSNRLFEWVTTIAILGMGISKPSLGLILLPVGITRVAALIANGHWRVLGPRVRAFGALMGVLIWYKLAMFNPAEFALYLALMLGECVSMYRAATDVRVNL